MPPLYPESLDIPITQVVGAPDSKVFESVDQLLLILPEPPPRTLWTKLPQGRRLQALLKKRPPAPPQAIQLRLANRRQTLVTAATLKAERSAFEQLTFARKLVALAGTGKSSRLGIAVLGFDEDAEAAIAERMVSAVLAACFRLPAFKANLPPPRISALKLMGLRGRLDLARARAEAVGNNLARWLTVMPPNKLDARSYADLVKEMAAEHGWSYKRYKVADLEKIGAGAFLAVAQGNDDDSASIVRLRYRPKNKPETGADLSLVGKGIIFDTGGINLKPFQNMLDMHGDMQGSAVALGTLLAISELGLPIAADCWLALTENRTGPRAYKSQDLITAVNGKTIQTIHTDAEGRLALADTLVLASREKPRLIIDYATLTGSCIHALTTRYCGIFSNRSDWHPRLKRTGQYSGERVWPFPMGKEFLEELKSDVADIQQCSVKGTGDHILAASFLAEFVENDTPWVHIDLSAAMHKGGLAHIPTDVTGFGVRYTLSLLLDERLLDDGETPQTGRTGR